MKNFVRAVVFHSIVLSHAIGETVCVKILDKANLPLPSAEVTAQNLTRSTRAVIDTKNSKLPQAIHCFSASAGEMMKLSVMLKGFIGSSLDNIKVLPKVERSFTIILEFQEGAFDIYGH